MVGFIIGFLMGSVMGILATCVIQDIRQTEHKELKHKYDFDKPLTHNEPWVDLGE